jgi:hypothetical protein
MATRRLTQGTDTQREKEITRWSPVLQGELREVLTHIDAGVPFSEGPDRKRYEAGVDRFICALRELRKSMRTRAN